MFRKINRGFAWGLLPFVVGMGAMSVQTVFVRLAMSTFQGSEIALCIVIGHWLLLTGIGSRLAVRIRDKNIVGVLRILGVLYVVSVVVSAIMCVFSKRLIGLSQSEVLGIGTIFLISFVILMIPAVLNGMFFPLLVRAMAERKVSFPVHKVYSCETFGSAGGGIFVGLALTSGLDNLGVLFIAMTIFFVSFLFFERKGGIYRVVDIFVGIGLALCFIFRGEVLKMVWSPQRLEKHVETRYSSLVVAEYQGLRILFSNSSPIWVFDNEEFREELVHFPLLYHPEPETVLVVGVGNYELVSEILKHRSVKWVMVVQKDKILQTELNLYGDYPEWSRQSYGKVKFVVGDPVRTLRELGIEADVIILNVPLPVSAYLNSYYSLRFISLLKKILKEDGILAFHFPGSESFLSKEHVEYLKVMDNTARKLFRWVYWIPGSTVHLLATDVFLDVSFDRIKSRLKERKIEVKYIREYYLADRLSPFRLQFLNELLMNSGVERVNTIIKPIGFYYETVLWDKKTGGVLKELYRFLSDLDFGYIYAFLVAIPAFLILKRDRKKVAVRLSLFSLGFVSMSLVGLYIMIYQSYAGSIYFKIFLINLAFMLGAGLGARIVVHDDKLIRKCIRMAVSGVLFLTGTGIVLIMFPMKLLVYDIAIPVLMFFLGLNCGFLFPVLVGVLKGTNNRGLVSSSGIGYFLDVVGACVGIYIISAIFIPVYGILNSLLFLSTYSILILGICFICL